MRSSPTSASPSRSRRGRGRGDAHRSVPRHLSLLVARADPQPARRRDRRPRRRLLARRRALRDVLRKKVPRRPERERDRQRGRLPTPTGGPRCTTTQPPTAGARGADRGLRRAAPRRPRGFGGRRDAGLAACGAELGGSALAATAVAASQRRSAAAGRGARRRRAATRRAATTCTRHAGTTAHAGERAGHPLGDARSGAVAPARAMAARATRRSPRRLLGAAVLLVAGIAAWAFPERILPALGIGTANDWIAIRSVQPDDKVVWLTRKDPQWFSVVLEGIDPEHPPPMRWYLNDVLVAESTTTWEYDPKVHLARRHRVRRGALRRRLAGARPTRRTSGRRRPRCTT